MFLFFALYCRLLSSFLNSRNTFTRFARSSLNVLFAFVITQSWLSSVWSSGRNKCIVHKRSLSIIPTSQRAPLSGTRRLTHQKLNDVTRIVFGPDDSTEYVEIINAREDRALVANYRRLSGEKRSGPNGR